MRLAIGGSRGYIHKQIMILVCFCLCSSQFEASSILAQAQRLLSNQPVNTRKNSTNLLVMLNESCYEKEYGYEHTLCETYAYVAGFLALVLMCNCASVGNYGIFPPGFSERPIAVR